MQGGFIQSNEIFKSKYDHSNYEEFLLKNGLKVLVVDITDENKKKVHSNLNEECSTKMAAVSLVVNAGSNDEPSEFSGLAHFLEHMLFMGSKKYPNEDDFDSFVSRNGGIMNAYTDLEKTCYYFTISQDKLFLGTDIFVNFFVDPLLKENTMNREVEAVDTEFTMATSRNNNHVDSVLNTIFECHLPHAKFNYGNRETLLKIPSAKGINMREKLLEFFQEHYRSHDMTACIVIQDMARDEILKIIQLFEQIPSKEKINKRIMYDWSQILQKKQFNYIYYVRSINNSNQLYIKWVLPPVNENETSASYQYIADALGYEGAGTIDHALKTRNYISLLETSFKKECIYFSYMSLKIKLTDLGVKNIKDIIACVFAYIYLMNSEQPSYEFLNDFKHIECFNFLFRSKDDISELAVEYSNNMQIYPKAHYITEHILLSKFDADHIKTLLSYMSPEKAIIIFLTSHKQYKTNMSTEYFNAEYSIQETPIVWMDYWNNVKILPLINEFIYPPHKNEFLIHNFELSNFTSHNEYPQLIAVNPHYKIYYKYDHHFNQPKSVMGLCFFNPYYSKDNTLKTLHQSIPNNSLFFLILKILTMYWKQNVTTLFYQAQRNGYNVDYEPHEHFLTFSFAGFNENFNKFVNMCIRRMFTEFPSEEEFSIIKEALKKDIINGLLDRQRLSFHILHICSTDETNIFSMCQYIDLMDYSTSKSTFKTIFSCFCMVSLFQGTLLQQDAISIVSNICQFFTEPLKKVNDECFILKPSVYLFPITHVTCSHKNLLSMDKNSVLINIYKIPPVDYNEIVKLYVIRHIMKYLVFDILRTKNKLGYAVFTYVNHNSGLYELSIYVDFDSRKHQSNYVDKKVELCLKKIFNVIKKMKDDEFKEYIMGFRAKLTKPFPNLSCELQMNFKRIIEYNDTHYNINKLFADYALQLTKDDIQQAYHTYLIDHSTRRKLSIRVHSAFMDIKAKDLVETGQNGHDLDIRKQTPHNHISTVDTPSVMESFHHTHTDYLIPNCELNVKDFDVFKTKYCKKIDEFTPKLNI